MLTPIILVLTPIILAVAVVYIALSAYTPYKVLLTHTIQHQTAQVKCVQTVPCPYNITKQSEGPNHSTISVTRVETGSHGDYLC